MNNNKLKELFFKQEKLQEKLYGLDNLKGNQEFINVQILACLDELSEVLRETAWKNPSDIKYGWKKGQKLDNEKFKEELVDLLHFFINLCIAAGMGADELFLRYTGKNKINHKRNDDGY